MTHFGLKHIFQKLFWLNLAILVYNQNQQAYLVQNTVNNFQVWLLLTTVHII